MKWLTIVTHPLLVIASFCLVLVSGKSFGGFYLMYLLMALPGGGVHALAALAGFAMIVVSYVRFKRQSKFFIDPLLNILGVFSLYLSLGIFFFRSWNYNEHTFQQIIPLTSIALFVLISLGFLVYSIKLFAGSKPGNGHPSH